MDNVSSEDRDFVLWTLLRQTRDLIYGLRQRELNQYNISARQAAVLFTLHILGDEATPTLISKWLLRKPHSISGILNRMLKSGLITKTRDKHKQNTVRVAMTDKGREAYFNSIKRESFHEAMSCLSEEDKQSLLSVLTQLRESAIQKLGPTYRPLFP
ncbi:MarR family winged helix-turn-helix transcriptional regulator [Chloroflexota bacterium]